MEWKQDDQTQEPCQICNHQFKQEQFNHSQNQHESSTNHP